MKVHYASGTHPFPGWVNVDYEAGGEIQMDLLTDDWGDEIRSVTDSYVGHFLEHLTREEGVSFLRNVRSRAVDGGRLTVVGPDVVKAQQWVSRGAMTREFLKQVGKHGTPRGNDRGACHLWDCTGFEVVEMLKEAGWSRIKELPISRMEQLLPGVPVIDTASWQFLIVAYADSTSRDS